MSASDDSISASELSDDSGVSAMSDASDGSEESDEFLEIVDTDAASGRIGLEIAAPEDHSSRPHFLTNSNALADYVKAAVQSGRKEIELDFHGQLLANYLLAGPPAATLIEQINYILLYEFPQYLRSRRIELPSGRVIRFSNISYTKPHTTRKKKHIPLYPNDAIHRGKDYTANILVNITLYDREQDPGSLIFESSDERYTLSHYSMEEKARQDLLIFRKGDEEKAKFMLRSVNGRFELIDSRKVKNYIVDSYKTKHYILYVNMAIFQFNGTLYCYRGGRLVPMTAEGKLGTPIKGVKGKKSLTFSVDNFTLRWSDNDIRLYNEANEEISLLQLESSVPFSLYTTIEDEKEVRYPKAFRRLLEKEPEKLISALSIVNFTETISAGGTPLAKVEDFRLGVIFVPYKSVLCNTHGLSGEKLVSLGECPHKIPGFFICLGAERYFINRKKIRSNVPLIYKISNDKGVGSHITVVNNQGKTSVIDIFKNTSSTKSPSLIRVDMYVNFGRDARVVTDEERGTIKTDNSKKKKKRNLLENSWNVVTIIRILLDRLGVQSDDPNYIREWMLNFVPIEKRELVQQNADFNMTVEDGMIGDPYAAMIEINDRFRRADEESSRTYISNIVVDHIYQNIPVSDVAAKLNSLGVQLGIYLCHLLSGRAQRHIDDRNNVGHAEIQGPAIRLMSETLAIFEGILVSCLKTKPNKKGSERAPPVDVFAERATETEDTDLFYKHFIKELTANSTRFASEMRKGFRNKIWTVRGQMNREKQMQVSDIFNVNNIAMQVYQITKVMPLVGKHQERLDTRQLKNSQTMSIDIVMATSNDRCGLVESLALTVNLSLNRDEAHVLPYLEGEVETGLTAPEGKTSMLFLNGRFYGWCDGPSLREKLLEMRRTFDPKLNRHLIYHDVMIYYNGTDKILYIDTTSGRSSFPLLVIDTKRGRPVYQLLIEEGIIKPEDSSNFALLFKNGAIEFIDAREQNEITIATDSEKYETHAEIGRNYEARIDRASKAYDELTEGQELQIMNTVNGELYFKAGVVPTEEELNSNLEYQSYLKAQERAAFARALKDAAEAALANYSDNDCLKIEAEKIDAELKSLPQKEQLNSVLSQIGEESDTDEIVTALSVLKNDEDVSKTLAYYHRVHGESDTELKELSLLKTQINELESTLVVISDSVTLSTFHRSVYMKTITDLAPQLVDLRNRYYDFYSRAIDSLSGNYNVETLRTYLNEESYTAEELQERLNELMVSIEAGEDPVVTKSLLKRTFRREFREYSQSEIELQRLLREWPDPLSSLRKSLKSSQGTITRNRIISTDIRFDAVTSEIDSELHLNIARQTDAQTGDEDAELRLLLAMIDDADSSAPPLEIQNGTANVRQRLEYARSQEPTEFWQNQVYTLEYELELLEKELPEERITLVKNTSDYPSLALELLSLQSYISSVNDVFVNSYPRVLEKKIDDLRLKLEKKESQLQELNKERPRLQAKSHTQLRTIISGLRYMHLRIEELETRRERLAELCAEQIVKEKERLNDEVTTAQFRFSNAVTIMDMAEELYRKGIRQLTQNQVASLVTVLKQQYEQHLGTEYTHIMLDQTAIYGLVAALIPYASSVHGARNTFEIHMLVKAVSLPELNYGAAFPTISYIPAYPSRALTEGVVDLHLHTPELALGTTATIAIMPWKGFNQDDAVILNRSAIERGFMNTLIQFLVKLEIPTSGHGTTTTYTTPHPEPDKVNDPRFSKLNNDGIVKVGSVVEAGDCIIGAVQVEPPRKQGNKQKRRETSISVFLDKGKNGIVDRVYVTKDSNKMVIKVIISQNHVPELGDKFDAGRGQKGTVSLLPVEADLPRDENGQPPIAIMNPHAIPSRQTIGLLQEMAVGPLSLSQNKRLNSMAFRTLDKEKMGDLLQELGWSRNGYKRYINPEDGKYIEAEIFTGPARYKTLAHMVELKAQVRGKSTLNFWYRLPIKKSTGDEAAKYGTSQKMDEMTLGLMQSHGFVEAIQERTSADRTVLYFCARCGLQAARPKSHYGCINCKLGESTLKRCALHFTQLHMTGLTTVSNIKSTYRFRQIWRPLYPGESTDQATLMESREAWDDLQEGIGSDQIASASKIVPASELSLVRQAPQSYLTPDETDEE